MLSLFISALPESNNIDSSTWSTIPLSSSLILISSVREFFSIISFNFAAKSSYLVPFSISTFKSSILWTSSIDESPVKEYCNASDNFFSFSLSTADIEYSSIKNVSSNVMVSAKVSIHPSVLISSSFFFLRAMIKQPHLMNFHNMLFYLFHLSVLLIFLPLLLHCHHFVYFVIHKLPFLNTLFLFHL